MATDPARVGRNELCSCGSGKKYKRCCGSVDLDTEDAAGRFFQVAALLVGVMLLGGTAVFARAFFFDDSAKKVWSPEHGHYHTVGGSESAKAENGVGEPMEAATPVEGALHGLRAAELDAARAKAEPPGAAPN